MLVLLAALFLAPLGLAFWLYYGGAHSGARVNHGELMQPARPLPLATLTLADGSRSKGDLLRHHWTLLFTSDGACDAVCRKSLYDMRQVRLALDRDMERVQRVWIASGACCPDDFLRREQAGLIVIKADDLAAPLLQALATTGQPAAAAQRIQVIDPLGNLVLGYAPGAPAKGLLEDLKRLLKLSHIG